MPEPIQIDIWSDIACPWCYIGKRRLEQALDDYIAEPDAAEVKVVYHSYELSPDLPGDFEGSQLEWLVDRKGMSREQVAEMLQYVSATASQEGLTYDFDAVITTKTLLAHELLHYAAEQGVQLQLVEELFKAYFVTGEHVGKPESLATIAERVGLDRAEVLEVLSDHRYADAVAADIELARRIGVQGVPFYVLDGQFGVSGAQDPAVFRQAIAEVIKHRGGTDD